MCICEGCVCAQVCVYACEKSDSKQEVQTSPGLAGSCHRGQHALPARGAGCWGVEAVCGAGRRSHRVLPRSTGAALCPRACALCSCFTVDGGPGIPPMAFSNPWRGWFLAPRSEEGSGMAPGSEQLPRGERGLLRGLPGCSGPLSSLCGALVGFADPCGSQAVLKVRRLGAFLSRQAGHSPKDVSKASHVTLPFISWLHLHECFII